MSYSLCYTCSAACSWHYDFRTQHTKEVTLTAPQYLCELLPTTVGEHSQRSLRNENDLKEMKGRTETFRGSFIPDAIKRYNYNQKGNVIDRNDNIAVEMNRKLFEYGTRATAVKHAQLRMKCSLLSGHLYDLHVVDSPACQCGLILKILITSSLIVHYLELKEQNYWQIC